MEEIKNGTISPEINLTKTNMAGKYSIQIYADDSLSVSKEESVYKVVAAADIENDDIVLFEHNIGVGYPITGVVLDNEDNRLDDVRVAFKYNRSIDKEEYKQILQYMIDTYNAGIFRLFSPEKIILGFMKDGYRTKEIPISDLANQNDIKIVMTKID